jgi:predicted dinucleotide-utilizing enzyme
MTKCHAQYAFHRVRGRRQYQHQVENVPAPENPKTAWLACYSALAALKLAKASVRYGT